METTVEIIKGNPVTVRNATYISSGEAALILNMTRPWVSSLMRKYHSSKDDRAIPCVVIGGQYFSTESQLKAYYEKKVERFKREPRN